MTRFLASAIFLAGAFSAAHAADVTGSWHITGSVADNPVDITCALVQKDALLTGSCARKDGKSTDLTGSLKGGSVSWHYATVFNGEPITVTFTCDKPGESTMAGKITVDPYGTEGAFNATKSGADAK